MYERDVIEAKQLRADIIELLYHSYGESVAIKTLRNMLRYKPYSSEKNVDKAIEYLSGTKKEYISVEISEKENEDSIVKLTPTGVNLAEGDIKDVGVGINE